MNSSAVRLIGICLVSMLFVVAGPPTALGQQSQSPSQAQPQSDEAPVVGQPTMPPINRSQLPDNPAPSSPGTATSAPNPPEAVQTAAPPQPTGTAAAEVERPAGAAAARPAGAAIAPPKQRQVRSFLIKMGLIAGAGVALGTVAALSMASPARVPNTSR